MSDVQSAEPEIWKEIKELEQWEADAMLRADVATLGALWSDDLQVNSTANLIADKQILLSVIASGRLRLKSYSRLTVTVNGATVITTGNESLAARRTRRRHDALLQLHERMDQTRSRLATVWPSRRPDFARSCRFQGSRLRQSCSDVSSRLRHLRHCHLRPLRP